MSNEFKTVVTCTNKRILTESLPQRKTRMMRKSNLGTGNVQRSVLKSRNVDSTPSNRGSIGQPGRKSHLGKASQPDSAKRISGRIKRGSTESITRLSTAGGRYTPTRSNLASSHIIAPPSASRMSFDAARGSSMGSKGRKDTRPIGDPAFKSRCIDKVMDFLENNGYEYGIQRRTLLTPSTKDFVNIFNFVYRYLDSSYVLPNRFEEEIPRLLKLMAYPVQMSKSSFITVGSPHTWPSVLAMLAWLVDVVNTYESLDPVSIAFPVDFESSINLSKIKFSTHVNVFKCERMPAETEAYLEEYRHTLELAHGVRSQDMVQVQEEHEQLENEVAVLSSRPERLQQLRHQYTLLLKDEEKMTAHCRDLQVHISSKDSERVQLESKLSEVKAQGRQVQEEVSRLERQQAQQALSVEELARLKNHANDVDPLIAQHQQQGKDFDTEIWALEMELGKAQKTLCDNVYAYNTLVHQLEFPKDFEISSVNISDNIHHWQTTLLNELHVQKKKAKHDTYQSQSLRREKEEEINKIKEMVQEKNDQVSKKEKRLQRMEEDILMTKKEIAEEEREMRQECERLHQQIIEARKVHKGSLYQKQCALDKAKEELEATKIRGKERARAGAEFLIRVCNASLEHLDFEQREALKFKNNVEKVCKAMTSSLETTD